MDANESRGIELLLQVLDGIVHRVVLCGRGRVSEFVRREKVRHLLKIDELDALADFGRNAVRIG